MYPPIANELNFKEIDKTMQVNLSILLSKINYLEKKIEELENA